MSQQLPPSLTYLKDSTWEKEKWYGTEYQRIQMDLKFFTRLKDIPIHSDLALPCKNEFLPSDFQIYSSLKTEVNTLFR